MRKILLPLYILVFLMPLLSRGKKVAVCISGQVNRWIPELIVDNLIHSNKDVYFYFFIHLQFSNEHHQTSFNYEFGVPSKYTNHTLKKSLAEISEMYTTSHSELVEFKFHLPITQEEWEKLMHREGQLLDRISEYTERQPIILNMYRNQISCFDSIQLYENRTNTKFDYLINTREDIFFFLPLDLRYAFFQLDSKPQCGLVTKGCIVNYGVNMRMQIANRDDGMNIFANRLSFYQYLFTIHKQLKNPKCFELYQLEVLGKENCMLPVDLFPITSARINSTSGGYCLLQKEVQSLSRTDHKSSRFTCVPAAAIPKVRKMQCSPFVMKAAPPPSNLSDYLPSLSPSSSSSSSSSSLPSSSLSISKVNVSSGVVADRG